MGWQRSVCIIIKLVQVQTKKPNNLLYPPNCWDRLMTGSSIQLKRLFGVTILIPVLSGELGQIWVGICFLWNAGSVFGFGLWWLGTAVWWSLPIQLPQKASRVLVGSWDPTCLLGQTGTLKCPKVFRQSRSIIIYCYLVYFSLWWDKLTSQPQISHL